MYVSCCGRPPISRPTAAAAPTAPGSRRTIRAPESPLHGEGFFHAPHDKDGLEEDTATERGMIRGRLIVQAQGPDQAALDDPFGVMGRSANLLDRRIFLGILDRDRGVICTALPRRHVGLIGDREHGGIRIALIAGYGRWLPLHERKRGVVMTNRARVGRVWSHIQDAWRHNGRPHLRI